MRSRLPRIERARLPLTERRSAAPVFRNDARETGSRILLISEDPLSLVSRLPRLERTFLGPLIRRQLTRGGRRRRELERYGPAGAVDLCRVRALQVYMLGFAVLATVLAVTGFGIEAALIFGLMVLLAVAAISRAIRGAAEGRRWRRHLT